MLSGNNNVSENDNSLIKEKKIKEYQFKNARCKDDNNKFFFDYEIKISPFSNVFKGIFLTKLNKIVISSFTSKLKIQKNNENAFYDCH